MKILLLVFVLLFIVFGPIVTIWALNTLFGLTIPLTFSTWVASCWLGFVVFGSSSRKR